MKSGLLLTALLLSFGIAVAAQQETQFPDWMEAATQNVGRLALSIQYKDAVEAASAAKELQEIFGAVSRFFKEKNSAGAAKYASDAQAGFRKVEELVSVGELDEAYKTMQATRANCEYCHNEHREKAADGSYRIKF